MKCSEYSHEVVGLPVVLKRTGVRGHVGGVVRGQLKFVSDSGFITLVDEGELRVCDKTASSWKKP